MGNLGDTYGLLLHCFMYCCPVMFSHTAKQNLIYLDIKQ